MPPSGVAHRLGEMTGGVDAAQRRRQPDLIEAGNGNVWGAAQARVRHARVQACGDGIEPGVEVVEGLLEIIDAGQSLADELRRDHAVVDQRKVVHAAGGHLIVVDVRRTNGRGLRSRSHEVAEGDVIPRIQAVVDLADAVVAEIIAVVGAVEVVGVGAALAAARGPERQQIGGDGVDRDLVPVQHGRGLRHPRVGRLSRAGPVSHDELLALVGNEIEQLVVNDGAAQGPAELVVLQLRLGGGGGCEGRVGGQGVVAVEVIQRAVQHVRSGLDHHVDGAAAVASGFRVRVALNRELVDRVDRQQRACDARDSALVHGRRVVPCVVVIRAVDLPVVLRDPGAVDGARPVHARRQLDELREVASVERHVLNRLARDHLVESGRVGVDRDRRRRHFHGLAL